ncbi:MAG: MoaD/ThiS family protein [Ilumatobacteraceae bacterium]
MAILRLFASAREAAGTGRDDIPGATVGELLTIAGERYGPTFVQVLGSCKVWVNGEAASTDTAITAADEVAVLPPVSGGAFESGTLEIGVDADQIVEDLR